MLRFAIPEYRLPKSVLRRELDLIEGVGVKLVFNTRVGFDLPLNELASSFDAVFLSIGTWKESWLYLPGTELKNVYPALPFLEVGGPPRQSRRGRKGCDYRRRQRGHRFGAHRPAHGRTAPPSSIAANAKTCPPSTRRFRRPRKRACALSFSPRRIASSAAPTAASKPSRSSRPASANTTNPAAAGPSPPMRCSASNATASFLPLAKPSIRTSAAPPASNSRRKARWPSTASRLRPAAPVSMPAATSSPAHPTCPTP